MAHMVDRMMYSGQVPWHGLGIKLPDVCDLDTLRQLVFDWHVVEKEVRDDDGVLSGYKSRRRSDNGYPLCVVPKTTGLVEYPEAFDVLNAAATDGVAKFITAGTLDKGRRAWALATIPSAEFEIAGAPVKPYLLASTSHDTTLAIRYLFTATYVVCNNTLTGALMDAGVSVGQKAKTKHLPNVITLKHTSKVNERLDIAKALIESARNYFGAFSERALFMVNARFARTDMSNLAEQLFPVSDKQEEQKQKEGILSAPHKARAIVIELFDGKQRAAAHAPGTRWAAFNAVTEYIDHHTARRGQEASAIAESRFDATFFGTGARIRQQAMDLLLAA